MENTSRNKYLLKNTAVFALGNIGTKMISFFLVPLYTKVLTTNQYGTVDLVYTICTVLVPILTFNICESVMRFALDKDVDYNKIMSIGLAFLGMCTILGVLIFPCSGAIKLVSKYSIYIYLYSVSFGYCQMTLCYLRGKELLLQYSIGNIIHSFTIAIFNILFLLVLRQGIEGYFTAYIIAHIITACYAIWVGRVSDVVRHFSIDKKLLRQMVIYSVALIPNSFMWWVMNSSDRLMVISMIDASANGLYSVAYKIPSMLCVLTTIFNQAWSYSAIKEDSSADREEYNNNVYDRMVCVVCIIAAGLLVVMKPFMRLYVGSDYYTAWRYTPLLMVGFIFMTLGTFVATSYTVNKDSIGVLLSGTCGAVINVILNFLLIPILEVNGAALATCISYFAVFIFRCINTRKYLKLAVLKKHHIGAYLCLIVMGASMYWDVWQGQVLLILEFGVLVLILHKFVQEISRDMWERLTRKRWKRN